VLPFVAACSSFHRALHSFPTRRSSDLGVRDVPWLGRDAANDRAISHAGFGECLLRRAYGARASHRRFLIRAAHVRVVLDLGMGRSEEHTSDSSHVKSSYAVFCLKKKNI